jgi:hypothetical protein
LNGETIGTPFKRGLPRRKANSKSIVTIDHERPFRLGFGSVDSRVTSSIDNGRRCNCGNQIIDGCAVIEVKIGPACRQPNISSGGRVAQAVSQLPTLPNDENRPARK